MTTHSPSRAGFTIVELVAVIVIASILAASVTPAVSRLATMRESAGAWEIRRLLAFARERAVASGVPVGVRFSETDQTIELVTISTGGSVVALTDVLGRPEPLLPFEARFSSVFTADSVIAPTPADEDQATLWFDHTGTPHARTGQGVHAGSLDQDVQFTVGDAGPITAVGISGLVEGP